MPSFIVILLCIFSFDLFAQEVRLHGKVHDAGDDSELKFTNVALLSTANFKENPELVHFHLPSDSVDLKKKERKEVGEMAGMIWEMIFRIESLTW
ncbi:hypothetical protein [Algoriphagus sp.]|uniref:hypothetical protein n=1 Tax=Algoriphagus sp. TaxID=1872435 RepID=UPI0025D51CEE|nr:hypothetical protein [Algoriphagus sp.]